MIRLGPVHIIYIIMIIIIIYTMVMRKDTVLPCLIGLFAVGITYSNDFIRTIQIIFNSIVASGVEFIGIIIIISIVVALSKAMTSTGVNVLITKPSLKLMVNADVSFFIILFTMLIVSWFVWPSPAVALLGTLMLPVAVKAGLPAIGVAVAMNIAGHGIALSSDWIIQGAPGITAKTAELADATMITQPGAILYVVMAVVTVGVAFYMLKKDLALNKEKYKHEELIYISSKKVMHISQTGKIFAIVIPLAFLLDVIAMLLLRIKGSEASALIGGTAICLLAILCIFEYKSEALENITEFIREGFMFGIKNFAPVIIIAAFFFLGSEDTAKAILGPDARGIINDIGLYLSQNTPLSAAPVSFIVAIVGGISGLQGSGFAGLPLVGFLAETFGKAINGDVGTIAAIGQITSVWVGGGTLAPWGLIPVAAICGIEPMELARRNFIPVMTGFLVTTIVAIFLI